MRAEPGSAMQIEEDVVYWSWAHNVTEKNYEKMHGEGLAVAWAIVLLNIYLEQQKLTNCTDHNALR